MNVSPNNYSEEALALARQVMQLARNTLLVNMRFLDMALAKLVPVGTTEFNLATDGVNLFYAPLPVLREYKTEQTRPTRNYLHALLHCIFRHPYVHTLVNEPVWDLACDIAVENVINELNIPTLECARAAMQKSTIESLKSQLKTLTAEKLYRYFLDKDLSSEQIIGLRACFEADVHDLWYIAVMKIAGKTGRGGDQDKEQSNGQGGGKGNDKEKDAGDGKGNGNEDSQEDGSSGRGESEEEWKDISERMQQDLETFSKKRGDSSANLIQNLREVNRERYDYTAFLRQFATMHEAMKVNDDEFDQIFYTYGLNLYENMPLIEPLEYKDVKEIKDLVIAIDTSGSVRGELVQTFLQKTYNILKSEESFSKRFNLYIIQCDAEIKEAAKITTQREFDDYIKNLELKGFGGTDFRPVFGYVNWLLEKKEFTNLKGLIYFTDGYGVFPEKKPPYETAFVFIRDEYDIPEVPAWAIKLVLENEEL